MPKKKPKIVDDYQNIQKQVIDEYLDLVRSMLHDQIDFDLVGDLSPTQCVINAAEYLDKKYKEDKKKVVREMRGMGNEGKKERKVKPNAAN